MKKNNLSIKWAFVSLLLTTATITLVGDNIPNYEETKIVFEPINEDDDELRKLSGPSITRVYDMDNLENSVIKVQSCDVSKEYSGMNLEHEYEDYIYDLCQKYASEYEIDSNYLFQTVLVIGDQESNGTWDTNGIISSTNDYGEFQINEVNHQVIYEQLGYTSDELLNDKYKNAEAAVWIICNIIINKECKTDEDVYGMYNGWINWSNNQECVKYVDSCLSRNDLYFPTIGIVSKK